MSPLRWWNQLVAFAGDFTPGGVPGLMIMLFLVACLIAFALVYQQKPRSQEATMPIGDQELPEVPPEVLRANADELAGQGQYAEAVRERLREMVRALVDQKIITNHPGWTITELASAAAQAAPAIGAPLTEAGQIFSDIWYGKRPAYAGHDTRMRELATVVTTAQVGR